ncbi:hypothetical protein KY312_00700 [Candidatus Woesearchaeota archaeon]|nr:hypothetical protein [Candidatus Woesearchaeota archaeon]
MKKLFVLFGILLFALAGCYNADETVELTLENESTNGGLLEQIHEVAEEIGSEGEEETEEAPVEDGELPQLTVNETQLVNLNVGASDADDDTIVYTFSEPLDSEGRWQTNYGDAGDYTILITASDNELSTSKKVLLRVLKKNEAPVIANVPDAIDAVEYDLITLEPEVSDANPGDDVTVTISDPVGDDGIWETDYQSEGSYDVTITATDGVKTAIKEIKLNIANKNVPPEIKVPTEINIKEGQTIQLEPEVTDLDGDEVTVQISDPVGDDGIWETEYTDHGQYTITITATDRKDTTTKEINLVVEDVNKAPEILEITLG